MPTLYIRDVPPEVAEILKERAAADGRSLSAYVADALTQIAARPTNAEVVERLRDLDRSGGPETSEILSALTDSRR